MVNNLDISYLKREMYLIFIHLYLLLNWNNKKNPQTAVNARKGTHIEQIDIFLFESYMKWVSNNCFQIHVNYYIMWIRLIYGLKIRLHIHFFKFRIQDMKYSIIRFAFLSLFSWEMQIGVDVSTLKFDKALEPFNFVRLNWV